MVESRCGAVAVGRTYLLSASFVTTRVDAEPGEKMLHRFEWALVGHRHPRLPQSSSASRFTAGASGFLNFNQSAERPER